MTLKINRILDGDKVAEIIATIFHNRPIKIIRTISRTGRNATSVPWVYYENQITGDRFATFISFTDLLHKFWLWLESVNLMALALFQRLAISKVIYTCVRVGETVWTEKFGWVQIIEKEITQSLKQPIFWIAIDSDSRIEKIEPCFVEVF